MLNDPRILDTLLSDDVIMDTIGALEYDPELPVRQRHRDFLLNKVAFKEVVPIRDAVVKGKIHQAYR